MLEIIKEIKREGLQSTVDKYGLMFKPTLCDTCKSEGACQASKADNCNTLKFLLNKWVKTKKVLLLMTERIV